jgi:hypothetical protein
MIQLTVNKNRDRCLSTIANVTFFFLYRPWSMITDSAVSIEEIIEYFISNGFTSKVYYFDALTEDHIYIKESSSLITFPKDNNIVVTACTPSALMHEVFLRDMALSSATPLRDSSTQTDEQSVLDYILIDI